MLYSMSAKYLQDFKILPKFRCFQIVLISDTALRLLFNILVEADAIPCYYPWTTDARAMSKIFIISHPRYRVDSVFWLVCHYHTI